MRATTAQIRRKRSSVLRATLSRPNRERRRPRAAAREGFSRSCPSRRILDDGPLVVHDLPAFGGAPPEGGPAGHAGALEQSVGEQIVVGGDLQAVEAARLPEVL